MCICCIYVRFSVHCTSVPISKHLAQAIEKCDHRANVQINIYIGIFTIYMHIPKETMSNNHQGRIKEI